MLKLRNHKLIAKLLLVWFALFLGSAIASAVIQQGDLQTVCTSGGAMKFVDANDDDGDVKVSGSMDCPLCASMTFAPHPSTQFEKPSPLAHALQPYVVAHLAGVAAPPLPSRGPPRISL